MRDPDMMLSLLREMANDPLGRIEASMTFDMDEAEQRRVHHVELLIDAGYAEWTARGHEARITNAGYDFLNAVSQDETYREKFVDYFNRGMSFVEAASKIVDLVGKAVGGGG